MRFKGLILLAVTLIFSAVADAKVKRPPQYIFFAFDGAGSVEFWKKSLKFSEEITKQIRQEKAEIGEEAVPFRFSYYLSCPYYFDYEGDPSVYTNFFGSSRLNISSYSKEEVAERIMLTNAAFRAGHEIGSHACSHHSGDGMSYSQWMREFSMFNKLVFGFKSYGNFANPTTRDRIFGSFYQGVNSFLSSIGLSQFRSLQDATTYTFTNEDIVGYRAPLLDHNNAMNQVMAHRNFHFRYDTSDSEWDEYWPKPKWTSQHGHTIWYYPMHDIRIAGTSRSRTISMDYNFSVVHSRWAESDSQWNTSQADPRRAQSAADNRRDNLFQSYMMYFNNAYYDHRTPMQIGHHFAGYGGGNTGRRPYNEALFKFAKAVCGRPEVICTTGEKIIDFLDEIKANGTFDDHINGRFERYGN